MFSQAYKNQIINRNPHTADNCAKSEGKEGETGADAGRAGTSFEPFKRDAEGFDRGIAEHRHAHGGDTRAGMEKILTLRTRRYT